LSKCLPAPMGDFNITQHEGQKRVRKTFERLVREMSII
jgi:hypothetical protein